MSDLDRRMLLGAAGLVGVAALSRVAKAGPLNPPAGPVTSTGKTLTEVEPRTLLSAATTPGDASNIFIISQPGSYYLGANLNVPSGKSGIRIDVSNVTVDLNGFTVSGPAAGGGGSAAGVTVGALFLSGLTVRNGRVRQMGSVGIGLGGASLSRVEDITATGNSNIGVSVGDRSMVTRVVADSNSPAVFNPAGISAGSQCVVSQCSAIGNAGNGILVGETSIVSECVATGNQQGGISGSLGAVVLGCTVMNNAQVGIALLYSSLVESCTVASNGGRGIEITFNSTVQGCTVRDNHNGGIAIGEGSVVDRCTSSFNTGPNNTGDGIAFGKGCLVKDCVANSNSGVGIAMLTGTTPGNGATIRGCNAVENYLGGITAGSDSYITDNNCALTTSQGSNLLVNGGRNRVERNNATGNGRLGYGINVAGSTNIIYANSSTGSSLNWNFGTYNVYGPIVDRRTPPFSGAFGSGNTPSTMGTTDPFANISY